jgi:hypothetical protein
MVLYVAFPKLRSQWRLYLVFLSAHDFIQGFYYASNWILEFENVEGNNHTTGNHNTGNHTTGNHTTGNHSGGWRGVPPPNINHTVVVPPWCLPQAVIGMYSATASFLWTAGLSIFIHRLVSRWTRSLETLSTSTSTGAGQVAAESGSWLYVAVCCGYPFVVQIAVVWSVSIDGDGGLVLLDGYLKDEYGCFIGYQHVLWRIVSVYGPLWISMAVTTFCYVSVSRRLGAMVTRDRTGRTATGASLARIQRKMLLVPLIFVLLRLPESIQRVGEFILMGQSNSSVSSKATNDALQGFQTSAFGKVSGWGVGEGGSWQGEGANGGSSRSVGGSRAR